MPVIADSNSITISIGTSGSALVTSTPWTPFDVHSTPFNVGFGVIVSGTGDVTFKVEHTFDNVFNPDATIHPFTHADVSAASATIDGNYAYGIRAARLTTVSASGDVTLHWRAVQVGI